jgi:MoxR-like ATPase
MMSESDGADREPGRESIGDVRDRIRGRVVDRERELTLVLAAVAAGRDILLEGPPGTSKTTLLKAITQEWSIPLVFVEGNADLTPAKLVGHHNPARVLKEDYTADNFTDGPLLQAMRAGGFLYIEEFNRAPEDTLNTLLSAMADRRIAVPRAGEVVAKPTFRVIASMNPYDNIGTSRLSTSVHDRFCRLALGYQDAASERAIVALRAPLPGVAPAVYEQLAADAVALARATRAHPDIRQGSSVRGAIDLTLIAGQLLNLDTERSRVSPDPAHDTGDPVRTSTGDLVLTGTGDPVLTGTGDKAYQETIYDAMVVALSGRIFLDETAERSPEQVLREIWEDYYLLGPAAARQPG